MALSYIGVSNVIATNGTAPGAITPHVSTAIGDLMLFWHFSRADGGDETVSMPAGWTPLFNVVTAARGLFACYYRYRQSGDTTVQATVTNHAIGTTGETIVEFVETYRSATEAFSIRASVPSSWAASTSLGPISPPADATILNGSWVIAAAGKYLGVSAQTTLTGDNLTWTARQRSSTTQGGDAALLTQTGDNASGSSQTLTAKTITGTVTSGAGYGAFVVIEEAVNPIKNASITESCDARSESLAAKTGEPSSAPRMLYGTYVTAVAQGFEWWLATLPAGYFDPSNAGKKYPVMYWFGGDGSMGNPTLVTDQVTNVVSATQFNGNFTNPSSAIEVAWGTVEVKVQGAVVARGNSDGTISGPGVTGTMAHTAAGGAFSLTFSSAPAATPTITYLYSPEFEAGAPLYVNTPQADGLGDLIHVMIHKQTSGTYFGVTTHWDDVLVKVESELRVDTNRRTVSGLSRGTFHTATLARDRYYEIAGFMLVAGANPASMVYSVYGETGLFLLNGQNESLDSITQLVTSYLNGMGPLENMHSPYAMITEGDDTLSPVGGRHNNRLWNTECYNRDTAIIDWMEWAKLWSLDKEQRVTLFVERAESTQKIDDQREAARLVEYLDAGAVKTDLLSRVAALKTTIDGGRKRWIIDFGSNSQEGLAWKNYLSNANAGQTLSNLKDDNGAASTVGFAIVTQHATSPTDRTNTHSRSRNGCYGFTQRDFTDGIQMEVGAAPGQSKFTGLNTGKTYKVSAYGISSSATVANNMELQLTIGGVTKSMWFSQTNIKKLEFTGVAPNGSGEIVIDAQNIGDTNAIWPVAVLEEETTGGSTTHDTTITEAGPTSETSNAIQETVGAITEPTTSDDALAGMNITYTDIVEPVSMTEASDGTLTPTVDCDIEEITDFCSDIISAIATHITDRTEAAPMSDAVDAAVLAFGVVTESTAANDASAALVTYVAIQVEPGGADDLLNALNTTLATLTEPGAADDLFTALTGGVESITEPAPMSEVSPAWMETLAELIEIMSGQDSCDGLIVYGASVEETSVATDAQGVGISQWVGEIEEVAVAVDILTPLLDYYVKFHTDFRSPITLRWSAKSRVTVRIRANSRVTN
jgi:hypothetical protein